MDLFILVVVAVTKGKSDGISEVKFKLKAPNMPYTRPLFVLFVLAQLQIQLLFFFEVAQIIGISRIAKKMQLIKEQ